MFSVSHEQAKKGVYASKAEERKNIRRMKNGPGRKRCSGDRVEKSVGFSPDSFDRVLLDAPCSALGLRPRLFSGEVVTGNLFYFTLILCHLCFTMPLYYVFTYSWGIAILFRQCGFINPLNKPVLSMLEPV